MLNIIYGRAGVGKTYKISEMIKNDIKNGKECVLLVPEQFTFESEKNLLHLMNNFDATKVTILSFTRLYDEILRLYGGNSKYVLNEAEKCIFMSRAVKTVEDKLVLWNKYTNKPDFIQNAVKTVNELKLAGITYDNIINAAQTTERISLRNKLNDIGLIFKAYEALSVNKYIDPVDKLSYINNILLVQPYFKGKNIYIDSFNNFAGIQYRIIERIINSADNVTFSITTDTHIGDDINIFYNTRKTLQNIIRIAEKYSIQISEPVCLTKQYYNSSDVAGAEKLIATGNVDVTENNGNVTVYKANDKNGEAAFVARTIRKLVRTENYRYNDFVIISRNTEDYITDILSECKKNKVFCFADRRTKLSNTPLIIMLIFALKCMENFNCENIFRFLKTGFGTLNFDEISILENYSYLWNGKLDWNKNWNMSPKGFVNKEEQNEKELLKEKAELEVLNALRQKAIKPLLNLKSDFKETALKRATALYNLLLECNTKDKLKELITTDNGIYDKHETETLKQSWKYTVNLLDSIVKCYDDEIITDAEFISRFNLVTDITTVGNVPQMLDEVTFGSADRIRPSRPKIVFVIGCNQGVLPAIPSNSGLFGINDRQQLIKLGFEISDNTISSSIDESLLVYKSISPATDKLYITYSSLNIKGEKLEKSAFVSNIEENIPGVKLLEQTAEITEDNAPETAQTAFEEYCRTTCVNNDISFNAEDISELSEDFEILKTNEKFDKNYVSSENASKLFGDNLKLSATQFDNYHNCAFSYLCKYGIKAKKQTPADLNQMQRGTITHYVLEHFVNNHKNDIRYVDESQVEAEVEQYIQQYLSNISGCDEISDEHFKFLLKRISEATVYTIKKIIEEFNYSQFNPECCELKIGKDKQSPCIDINFGEHGNISIDGSVDRLDVWDNYVRIIDYKTGGKTFKLPNVLFGLDMQMLIYLYAIVKGKSSAYKDYLPAGILYLISKKNIKQNDNPSNGLLVENENVSYAMNSENDGRFLPKLDYDKKGNIKGNAHIENTAFYELFDYIEYLCKKMASDLNKGNFPINPIKKSNNNDSCQYCDYKTICMFFDEPRKIESIKNSDVMNVIRERIGGNNEL